MNFLSQILAAKRQRLEAAKQTTPFAEVRDAARRARAEAGPHRLAEALRNNDKINIIGEFKRCSPSKGYINPDADPAGVARLYASAGATAISVLTEEDYFEGSLEDLRAVRGAVSLPILRKDFIFEEYQVYESAADGADALLLIVAVLDDQTLRKLREIAEDELGIDALVEVHTKDELDRAVACGARLIGVNNRDLHTFRVSVATSAQIARSAPANVILVSESGLYPEEVRKLHAVGYRGFLVGEALMRASDPARTLRQFIRGRSPRIYTNREVKIKVCGITSFEDARAAIDAGADMLGFNFYRGSSRFVEPDAARVILSELRSGVVGPNRSLQAIGVFVNETLGRVLQICEEVGLDGVQLHGDETAEFCRQFKVAAPKRILIKAFPTKGALDLELLEKHLADVIMLDAYDNDLRGGTGRLADWTKAGEAADVLPQLFLAGGLSPENVAQAVAAVHPYGVDACSALEISPGKKDHARMREFVAAVRASKLPVEVPVA